MLLAVSDMCCRGRGVGRRVITGVLQAPRATASVLFFSTTGIDRKGRFLRRRPHCALANLGVSTAFPGRGEVCWANFCCSAVERAACGTGACTRIPRVSGEGCCVVRRQSTCTLTGRFSRLVARVLWYAGCGFSPRRRSALRETWAGPSRSEAGGRYSYFFSPRRLGWSGDTGSCAGQIQVRSAA